MSNSDDRAGSSVQLNIVGSEENVPRAIRGYGRFCALNPQTGNYHNVGYVAYMALPQAKKAALVIELPGESRGSKRYFMWQNGTRMVGADGKKVRYDAPMLPGFEDADEVSTEAATDALDKLAAAIPPEGDVAWRGSWNGKILCTAKGPQVVLQRRIATYGVIAVASHLNGTWEYAVILSDKWFVTQAARERAQTHTKRGFPTLHACIGAAYAHIIQVVEAACVVSHTARRAVLDPAFAAKRESAGKHATRSAVELRRSAAADPTAKMRARAAKSGAPPKSLANKIGQWVRVVEDVYYTRGKGDKAKQHNAKGYVGQVIDVIEKPQPGVDWGFKIKRDGKAAVIVPARGTVRKMKDEAAAAAWIATHNDDGTKKTKKTKKAPQRRRGTRRSTRQKGASLMPDLPVSGGVPASVVTVEDPTAAPTPSPSAPASAPSPAAAAVDSALGSAVADLSALLAAAQTS